MKPYKVLKDKKHIKHTSLERQGTEGGGTAKGRTTNNGRGMLHHVRSLYQFVVYSNMSGNPL